MNLPTIGKINFKGKPRSIALARGLRGKRVLLRVSFNVPIKKGKVAEDFRIQKTFPTIRLLKSQGAKIILLSHLGEKKESLKPVAHYLRFHLRDFKFISSLFSRAVDKAVSQMKDGDIIMLENLRRDKGEEKNNKNFAKKLAKLGDIYVNEDFGVSHREHASIVGLPKYLPSYAGLLFESEVKNLTAAFKPKHPFLLILGGIKFESKLGVLSRFIKIADKIFIGGALANNFFKLKGMDIGNSVFDEKVSVSVKKYLNNPKIVLPVDIRKNDGVILDAGPKAVKELCALIKKAKFILWNGPLGNYEIKGYGDGTKETAKAIACSSAFSIVGGGDSVAAADKAGVLEKFSFVSTGGGAMLEFLAEKTLPGIKALIRSKK